jgi:hypothetical protein
MDEILTSYQNPDVFKTQVLRERCLSKFEKGAEKNPPFPAGP